MTFADHQKRDDREDKDPISRRAVIGRTIEATSSVKVDANTAVEVRALITRSLFSQAPAYLAIEAAAAVLATGIYLYLAVGAKVIAWLVLCLAALIVRWIHVLRYFARPRDADDSARWARVFALGALLSGSLWGIGNVLAFSPDNPSLLIVQIFMVTGLSAMALTGYSAHAASFYCFILPALVPFAVGLIVEGSPIHGFVAVLLSIWTGVFVYLCHLLSSRYFERTLFLAQSDFTAATKRAVDLADQANQAKTRFLANVSHEFRTPLNAIIGFSEAVRSGLFGNRDHPKYGEYIDGIHQSGLHLKQLVDDLLDVSRIEMGQMELKESFVDVGAVLRECERTMRIQFDRAKVQLALAYPSGLPALCADPVRLKQVVLNLLTNALKFSSVGGEVWVTTGTDDTGDLMLHISDTGIGMKNEDIPRALMPFVQLAQPPRSGDHGVGIGLHLVKVLVEAHEGRLMIHSEPGRGTVVTARFPRKRLASRSGDAPSPSLKAAAPPAGVAAA